MEDSCDLAGGYEFIDLIQSQRDNLMFKSGTLTLFLFLAGVFLTYRCEVCRHTKRKGSQKNSTDQSKSLEHISRGCGGLLPPIHHSK